MAAQMRIGASFSKISGNIVTVNRKATLFHQSREPEKYETNLPI
jgi:hypothetical protein